MRKSIDTAAARGSVDQLVEAYLDKVGLVCDVDDADDYWVTLTQTHGAPVIRKVLAAMHNRRPADLYRIMNRSLQLSLDLQFLEADLVRQWLTWVASADLGAPRRILDLGCGNGVTTCFYADIFPDAEIVGIDRSRNAIARARELAALNGVANVSFTVAEIATAKLPTTWDLITSVCALYHVVRVPQLALPLLENLHKYGSTAHSPLLARMGRLLRHNGILLLAERLPDTATIAEWVYLLGHAGLEVDAERSGPLLTSDFSVEQVFPRILARPHRSVTIEPRDVEVIAAQLQTGNVPRSSDALRVAAGESRGPLELRGIEAARVIERFPDREIYGDVELYYLDGTWLSTLSVTDDLALLHRYEETGTDQSVTITPRTSTAALVDLWRRDAGYHTAFVLTDNTDVLQV